MRIDKFVIGLILLKSVRHGVKQLRTGWADGPEYITQCPILPGRNFTQRFTITGQEGTLFWHPFPKPNAEVPVIIGDDLL